MSRNDRKPDEIRPVKLEIDTNKYAEGSVTITVGDTIVLCNATVEEKVPPFMKGQGRGWVTAEYSMLPRATHSRSIRESAKGKLGGRTMEIQRLIARALRAVVDLQALGERTIIVDCDVIQADGGTRTTSITGAFVAMCLAMNKLEAQGKLKTYPITDYLASVSVGVVDGEALLDLRYDEDSSAAVDMNIVMTGAGEFVELQGTGEERPFSRAELNALLELGEHGVRQMIGLQREALGANALKIGSYGSGGLA